MITRLCKLLFFLLIIAAASFPVHGEGEWEDPDNAPAGESDSESGDSGGEAEGDENGGEAEQPRQKDVDEAEPRRKDESPKKETRELAEPELEPPEDTFPVVAAADAAAPRPRNPERILDTVELEKLTEKLNADRLLLSEIRKDVPEAREEAELYLVRLKELAETSDPVRLVPLFDRVLDQAPIYFEWLETEYENQDEQITEYYVGGARGFAFAMDKFRSAVFFVIMNRLDIASRVISELE